MLDKLLTKIESALETGEEIALSPEELALLKGVLTLDMVYTAVQLALATRTCLFAARDSFWGDPRFPPALEYWRLHNATVRALKPVVDILELDLSEID